MRTKLLSLLIVAGTLPLAIVLIILQTMGYRQLVDKQGSSFQESARHIAESLELIVARDINHLRAFLSVENLGPSILAAEALTENETAAERQDRTARLEARWPELTVSSPELEALLKNPIADRMRIIQTTDPVYLEILVADRHGRLLAATGKSSDYDQSDEAWWQHGIKLKQGDAYVGGLEFDRSVAAFSLDLVLPIFDPRTPDQVMAVVKAVINAGPVLRAIPLAAADEDIATDLIKPDGRILLRLSDKNFAPDSSAYAEAASRLFNPDHSGWFIAPLEGERSSMVGFAPLQMTGVHTWNGDEVMGEPLLVAVHQHSGSVLSQLRLHTAMVSLVGAILIAASAAIGIKLAQRDIISPIEKLRNAAREMAATTGSSNRSRFAATEAAIAEVSRIKTGDEMEALAGSFASMAQRLLRHQQELQSEIAAKTAEIQRDLEMARDFQQAFLPRAYPQIPSVPEEGMLNLHFHHLYKAAMSVSGDFFDIIKLDDDRAGVLIADVMGHGTRSALVTAILRTLLHGLAKTADDPGHFLSLLNQHFFEALRQTEQVIFVSACFVVFDTRQQTLRYASAGHPSPMIGNRRTGEVVELYDNLTDNPALGLFPATTHTTFQRALLQDDVLLLFTDGLVEAMSSTDEEFGRERVLATLRRHLQQSLKGICDDILEDVLEFAEDENLTDDLCLVAAEASLVTAQLDSKSAHTDTRSIDSGESEPSLPAG